MAKYKQRCNKCKKNYVMVGGRERFVMCYDCQKRYMEGEIKSAKMKKLLE